MPITGDDGDSRPVHRRPARHRCWGDGEDVPSPADRGVYTLDFVDGDVWRWRIGEDGAVERTVDAGYAPTLYVASTDENLAELESHLSRRPAVAATGIVRRRTRWRREPEEVLRVDVDRPETVRDVAHEVRGYGAPGEYELFDVDFTREYRYCLERGVDPAPPAGVTPSTLSIALDRKRLSDGDVSRLRVDGETVDGGAEEAGEAAALRRLRAALDDRDPDALVVSHGALLPLLHDRADALGVERGGEPFHLGRVAEPRFQQLAGASSFHSYGRLVSSPARYTVPGRAVLDESNGFLLGKSDLHGLLDLVARSRKPLQELGWASIGNVFTSLQVREAFRRGVLVPWKSWRHEFFKPMATLHESDRGGHILSPDVGLHEDVVECDFAALYPNVMVTRNVSPDVILCDCHGDRADVPTLGYNVCDDDGYLRDVLRPLIADRQAMKRRLAGLEDGGAEGGDVTDRGGADGEAHRLRGPVEALKWIMVSCFGYQGFSNAKFGRIECHEAINAHAREILLDAKHVAEQHGWRVVHGIVDSLWLRPVAGDPTPIEAVCRAITDAIGIPLEFERRYDWIAFVPCRGEERRGALNRYFGVGEDGETKTRGIECRQRSTPPYVAEAQERFLEVLDATREPADVVDAARERIVRLRSGDVDPEELVVTRKVSKEADDYERGGRAVAALERAAACGVDVRPGEDVRFVVADDDAETADRVRLAFEEPERYDADHYADRVVRACESVVSPLGWDAARVRRELRGTGDLALSAF